MQGKGRKTKNNCLYKNVQDTEFTGRNKSFGKGFPVRKHVLHKTIKCRGASVPPRGPAEWLLPHRLHLATRKAVHGRGWAAGPRARRWDAEDVGIWAGMIFGWLRGVSAVISEMIQHDAFCAW